MPEGDTIFRTAGRLRQVLDGQTIVDASGEALQPDATSLVGCMVCRVESRGKHLLVHLDDRRVLHSHMGMKGSWFIRHRTPGIPPSGGGTVLTLTTGAHHVSCRRPRLLELVSFKRLQRNRWLQRLGPDLMTADVTDDAIPARFRTQQAITIGEAVLNQSVVSGIGNIYKSEVLFLVGIHPQMLTGHLSDAQLGMIVMTAAKLLRQNAYQPRRVTRRRSTGSRVWVYDRAGQPCLRCDTIIQRIRQGDLARATFYCPACQPLTDQPATPATAEDGSD